MCTILAHQTKQINYTSIKALRSLFELWQTDLNHILRQPIS